MSLELVALAVRFGVMAITTFLAIVVWARQRDAAWMLIVTGILAGYADILYALLVELGLLPDAAGATGALASLLFLFPNLPWVFFFGAFIVMIVRRRRPRH